MKTEPLLQLEDYTLHQGDGTPVLEALDLAVGRGEIVGVVGESGSGKSQLLRSLLGLAMRNARTTGSALFDGAQLVGAREAQLRALRGRHIGLLLQDPLAALNPYLKLGVQLTEIPRLHAGLDRQQSRQRAEKALAEVGLPDPARLMRQHAHELSGGMRQRVLLAMALLGEPQLLLADEPTTALDATTQLGMLDLLQLLRDQRGMAILLVTHDLGVIARVAERVVVMQGGRIVERGTTAEVLRQPRSVYGAELLRAACALEEAGDVP
jgi:ABC-type glutathione transport system ATPase component